MKKSILLFVLVVASIKILAQSNPGKARISVEIDPSTFVFKGYAFHVRVQPKNSQHLLLGAGTYAMNFPDVLVNLNKNNKDMGWQVRLNQGYGLFGEYHFSDVNKKWFVGTQLAIQQYTIAQENTPGEADYTTMLAMALGGYTWQPFNVPIYFKFWGGMGYTTKIAGENTLGNSSYNIAPLLFFGALHVGYTF